MPKYYKILFNSQHVNTIQVSILARMRLGVKHLQVLHLRLSFVHSSSSSAACSGGVLILTVPMKVYANSVLMYFAYATFTASTGYTN